MAAGGHSAVRTNWTGHAQSTRSGQLLYVHCISSEDIVLIPRDFSCVEVVCREIHVSLPDSLRVRRVASTPAFVDGEAVDDLFSAVRSPALIRVESSCDFKVRFRNL